MRYFDEFGIDIGYVIMGMAGAILLLFILLLITMIKSAKSRKRYKQFMDGENGKSLEKAFQDKFSAIDSLQAGENEIRAKIEDIDARLIGAYQKIGLVKYDAFKEIGGKLSFVLVLLTADDDGFLINSMHSTREGCYTYTKEIVHGESYVILSEEEQQALNEAKENAGLKNIVKASE